MTTVGTDYQQALETARQAAEAARQRAETAKAAAEKEATEATEADNAVIEANNNVTTQQNEYTAANSTVSSVQSQLDSAISYLNSLDPEEDEGAISSAQAEVDNLRSELERAQTEAQKEYEELVKAQQDAQTAIAKAEIERTEANTSAQELEVAEAELAEAEEALKQAEEAYAAAEAEAVKLAEEVQQLTEAEAIEQGYTVIKTVDELQAICENLGGKYILMGDIDLSGIDWEGLGSYNADAEDPFANAFTGEFNGNGYTISNLSTNTPEDSDIGAVGFFGATDGATITNLILDNVDINTSEEYNDIATGSLIGVSRNTDLDNITVSGDVSGHQAVGGVIGKIQNSHEYDNTTISNVNANVNVDASYYAGGLIGRIGDTVSNSLMIENCHTQGSIDIAEKTAGGLIGQAGKTVVTVNKCSSSMDITKLPSEDTGLSWIIDDTSRIGGVIGNCDGTYISICNFDYTGKLDCEDEFKGENYGWYMNDAQVSIFELSAGLPADDILNIEGIEDLKPIVDPKTGKAKYEISVSTLAGMNKIVDMLQDNPKLAQVLTYNVMFDFESMDEEYDHSLYAQYGIVQHLYEAEDGHVVNDVYIDNECDLETTFNVGFRSMPIKLEPIVCPDQPEKTMVEGLYKYQGKYYILTGEKGGKFEGFTEVTLEFYYENQELILEARLDDEDVALREQLIAEAHRYQAELQAKLKEEYGIAPEDSVPIIEEPEYKALLKKQAKGEELSDDEKLKMEAFELNYQIMNIVSDATGNKGCGMGGEASIADNANGAAIEDEYGQTKYTTLDGKDLREKVDEDGNPVLDENGNKTYVTTDGEDYDGSSGAVYTVTEDGNPAEMYDQMLDDLEKLKKEKEE